MKINKHTTLEEIKKEFASQFSGLKLEFFKKPHENSTGSPKKDMLESSVAVTSVNSDLIDGEIEWAIDMTCSELEQIFENKFGLHAQVFRLTGPVWIETTTTDSYTLEMQMNKSFESQTPI